MLRNLLLPILFPLLCSPVLAANNPANIPAVPTIAAMQALGVASAQYPTINVLNFSSSLKNGGGLFNWTLAAAAPGGSCTPDNGIVFAATGVSTAIACWVRQVVEPYHLNWWGADPTEAVDATTAIQAAFDAAKTGHKLILDCGAYKITSAISIPGIASQISGQSQSNPTFPTTSGCANIIQFTSNTPIFHFTGSAFNWSITDMHLLWNTQQTGSDPLSIGFYFDCPGCTFARFHIERIAISEGYGFVEVNHSAAGPSIFDAFIRDNDFELMAGSFLDDTYTGGTVSSSGNEISGNDIRGGLTVTGHALINTVGFSAIFDNNTFGQNNTLPVISIQSGTWYGDHWKLVEAATLDSVGNVVNCSTGNITIQSFESSGAVTPVTGKIYGFFGDCPVNIQGDVQFAFSGSGFSQYLDGTGSMHIGSISVFGGPSGTSTDSWTDIVSTGAINGFFLNTLTPYNLSADAGDANFSWTPGTSANVVLYNTPITADRSAQVANTYNLDGQTCLQVLRTANATGGHNVLLKDPGGSTIATLSGTGFAKICYTRTSGTNTATWFAGQ